MDQRIKAPGLKWIKRANGHIPVWVADESDVKAGYTPKTMNLVHLMDQPELIVAHCNAYQADMMLFRAGHRRDPMKFTGKIKSLLSIYQRHEESPFHDLKPSTLAVYRFYLGRLEGHIGDRRVDAVDGLDIRRWHKRWSSDGAHLAAAAMMRAVLEAAVSFGIMMRLEGCSELLETIRVGRRKLPHPQPRTEYAKPDQVVAARAAAHENGRPSSALGYALVFESTLRLWDVFGQWLPMDDPAFSDVLDPERAEKWVGLRWEDIGDDLLLSYTPSKTEDTTGRTITYPLSKAPMVIEELAHWPVEKRVGPVIVSEETGLPYRTKIVTQRWSKDRKTAHLPSTLWARDLRASGVTEGRALNVSTDDAGKVAGHSGTATTARVYDRAVLEAAHRFADVRKTGRERGGNGGGNAR